MATLRTALSSSCTLCEGTLAMAQPHSGQFEGVLRFVPAHSQSRARNRYARFAAALGAGLVMLTIASLTLMLLT